MPSPVSMNSSQYMKLLLTELKNQNPMQPMKNTEMMTQFSQLTTAQSMTEMKDSFGDILRMQKLSGGVNLLGREVVYESADGRGRGVVESVSREGGETHVRVNDTEVRLNSIRSVV